MLLDTEVREMNELENISIENMQAQREENGKKESTDSLYENINQADMYIIVESQQQKTKT